MMPSGYDLATCVAIFISLAAILDVRTRKIPNWLTVPAAAAGLLFHSFLPHGAGPLWSLGGLAVGFVLLLLPWLLGGGGMGDVKMLAALGAWLGPVMILAAFGMGAVLAAILAAGVLVCGTLSQGITATRGRYLQTGGPPGAAVRPAKARRVVPFAVPMAISTFVVLAWMLIKANTA
jgi:prepilin peptidase CpaA